MTMFLKNGKLTAINCSEYDNFVLAKPLNEKQYYSYLDLIGEDLSIEIYSILALRDGEWTCTVCNRASKNKRYAKEHRGSYVVGMECQCPVCGKVFKKSHALRNHIYSEHKNNISTN